MLNVVNLKFKYAARHAENAREKGTRKKAKHKPERRPEREKRRKRNTGGSLLHQGMLAAATVSSAAMSVNTKGMAKAFRYLDWTPWP